MGVGIHGRHFRYSHWRRLHMFIADRKVGLKDLVQHAFRLRHCLARGLEAGRGNPSILYNISIGALAFVIQAHC